MTMQQSLELPNGVRVLLHRMPSSATVSACFYVLSGARDETPAQTGAAHMLEHMLFRGSRLYSDEAIRRAMTETGSDMNAFTSWEQTCVYARMLPEYFDGVFAMVNDMVRHPRLDNGDYAVERSVVQEELARQLDEPRSRMLQELHRIGYAGRMGGNLIGYRKDLEALELDELRAFHQAHYVPGNTLVIIVGAFTDGQIEAALRILNAWTEAGGVPAAERSALKLGPDRKSRLNDRMFRKGTGIWGFALPPLQGEGHYAAHLLCTLLGDDNTMGSRLESALVRARLAEQANSVYTSYTGGGMLKIYSTFPGGNDEKVREVLHKELQALREGSIEETELRRAKNKMKTQLAVDASTTDSRMISMAQAWLPGRRMVTLQEVLARIDDLSKNQLAGIADYLLAEEPYEVIGEPIREPANPV
ncbi:pitrilysin family protein [Paenibacillus sp. M1]|uniref:Pitrilysin family protein n=1 Tax=Paenibacillus haidiansis TaxID=1574488 RepID=A0ABU7VW02_9BACL